MPFGPNEYEFVKYFRPGDMIFGLAGSIKALAKHFKSTGASPQLIYCTIDGTFTEGDYWPKSPSWDLGARRRELRSFVGFIPVESDNAEVVANMRWRRRSKDGLRWMTSSSRRESASPRQSESYGFLDWFLWCNEIYSIFSSPSQFRANTHLERPPVVHFTLEHLDVRAVVAKQYKGRDVTGGDFGKLRAVTGSELRWVYRNRHRAEVASVVQFWNRGRGGECVLAPCNAPWVDDPDLWAKYQPGQNQGEVCAIVGSARRA